MLPLAPVLLPFFFDALEVGWGEVGLVRRLAANRAEFCTPLDISGSVESPFLAYFFPPQPDNLGKGSCLWANRTAGTGAPLSLYAPSWLFCIPSKVAAVQPVLPAGQIVKALAWHSVERMCQGHVPK